jgi:hypothetical protein
MRRVIRSRLSKPPNSALRSSENPATILPSLRMNSSTTSTMPFVDMNSPYGELLRSHSGNTSFIGRTASRPIPKFIGCNGSRL